jgi:hypothetical protein
MVVMTPPEGQWTAPMKNTTATACHRPSSVRLERVRTEPAFVADAVGVEPHLIRVLAHRLVHVRRLAGISDFYQNLCFAIALWNGKDSILKERLFGLSNPQGNHGEDVKELYYYLDNLPTHYYMEYLYKYPQQAFPYELLKQENRKLSRNDPEYEILDTGIFNNNQYFDVLVTYAKQSAQDIFIKIDITNRHSKSAEIHLLPTLWFYNRWSVGSFREKPSISYVNKIAVKAEHERLGDYYFYFQPPDKYLFTENETNSERIFGVPSASPQTLINPDSACRMKS